MKKLKDIILKIFPLLTFFSVIPYYRIFVFLSRTVSVLMVVYIFVYIMALIYCFLSWTNCLELNLPTPMNGGHSDLLDRILLLIGVCLAYDLDSDDNC
jgi:hypothetical protein